MWLSQPLWMVQKNNNIKMQKNIEKQKGYRNTYILIISFILLVIFICVFKKIDETHLLENTSLTTGTVYGFPSGRQGVDVDYTYTVKGENFVNMEGAPNFVRINSAPFVSRSFPVIYDNTNPKNSHILIHPKDFVKYNIPFPDSLNWILPYFEKNK